MVKPLREPIKIKCKNPDCSKMFVPYRPQNVFCSDKCQETVYNRENDIVGRMRRFRRAKKQKAEA